MVQHADNYMLAVVLCATARGAIVGLGSAALIWLATLPVELTT